MAPSPRAGVLAFGVFELDLNASELRKRGVKLKLQDKPLAVLQLLLEHAGEVVTRDQIEKTLWPDGTIVEFERGISNAVHKLRLALSDTAENPRFIETVARHGYRFLAPLRRPASPAEHVGRRMLAVLPFENLSVDPEQEFFADGLTEEMISQLARLNPKRLGVIARTSAMRYKRSEKSAAEAGAELGVQYLLEGSVRRAKNRVRITAQLIQVADQSHLWAETFDRSIRDVIAIQSEVAQSIARSLALELVPDRAASPLRADVPHQEAYELCLLGRHHWNQRTEQSLKIAIDIFQKAADLAPDFVMPFLGLSDAFGALGYYETLPPKTAFERAKRAAHQALNLAPRLSEAYSSLAFCVLQYDWDWPAAERLHQKAVELGPGVASANHWYGIDLTQVGRFHEAQSQLEQALASDPFSVAVRAHLSRLFYFSRQYSRAIEEGRRAVALDPKYAPVRYFLGLALGMAGDITAAEQELEFGMESAPDHPAMVSALSFCLATAGRRAEAKRLRERLNALSSKRHVSGFYKAFAETGLGDPDAAFAGLEQAYADRSGQLHYLKIEPVFDSLRADPRFTDLMQRTDPTDPATTSSRE